MCRKKLSKIKFDKVLFKIELVILPIKNEILAEVEHKNIINSNLAS